MRRNAKIFSFRNATTIAAGARKSGLFSNERGETLAGLIVTMGLAAVILSAAIKSFIQTSTLAVDHAIIAKAHNEARAILDLMAYDIRMAGAGVPFGQSDYAIEGTGLGTAPLPILTTSDADSIDLRLSESGLDTVLTADFSPESGVFSFDVFSVIDFEVGDTIYISDMVAGGTAGLQGVIDSISGTTITIDSSYIATASTTFDIGSSVDRVTTVNYDSPSDWSGITRNAELGNVVINPQSTFSIEYIDSTGGTLALPLTEAVIRDELLGLILNVSVQGDRTLTNGSTYTAEVGQAVALRNLNIVR